MVHVSAAEATGHVGPSTDIGAGVLVCMGGAGSGDLVSGAAVPARIQAHGSRLAAAHSSVWALCGRAAVPAYAHGLDHPRFLRSADGHLHAAIAFHLLGFLIGYRHVLADPDRLSCDPISGAFAGRSA